MTPTHPTAEEIADGDDLLAALRHIYDLSCSPQPVMNSIQRATVGAINICKRQPSARRIAAQMVRETGWRPVEVFDATEMQFVLITDGDVVRLRLWNPHRRTWEDQPSDTPNATHFMPLPDVSKLRALTEQP